ncbi:MAG TPA: LPS export ABC transporter ATP-binding protein [Bdellovibrionales bacterium]|nr:LPS export ABC transporter ATP-binding protein [Bdellovibrionales bacterium]
MSASQLQVKGISKSFKARKVVDDVSFSIASGQVVGLLGPNGAGKTTSFYMVVGLVQPDKGEVLLDDQPITTMPMFQRARIGLSYLPQEPSIFRRLTVRENIMVALEARGYSGAERSEKLQFLIEDLKITHIENSFGYALSGGERRRVEIARALASKPKFLLLDEPFAGIDPIAVGDLQEIIRGLKAKGIGVLITDHNVRETLRICDRAYILKEGRVQVEGSSDFIANSDLARKYYLGENFQL